MGIYNCNGTDMFVFTMALKHILLKTKLFT